MQSMVISGVVIMLIISVLVKVWRVVIRLATIVFTLALGAIVIGFVFGGVDIFTSGSVGDWANLLDILLWEGVGERVVGAIVTFVQSLY